MYFCGIKYVSNTGKQTRKMKKEELLTKIQEVIGEPDANGNYVDAGISERTLDVYLDSILPTLDGYNAEDVVNAQVNIIKSMGGQLRHEKAEFVKNYKPVVKKQEGNEEQEEHQEQEQDDESADALGIKEMLKQLTELKNRFDEQEKSSKQERLREKVIAGMRSKNASDDYVLRTCMKGVQLDDSKSVDDLVEECLGLYDAEFKDCRSGNEPPRTGNNAGGENKDIDAFFEDMKKRGKI